MLDDALASLLHGIPQIACTLNPLKLLCQPHNRIRSLNQGKLLANANPRAAVKRQVLPPGFPAVPALRPILVRIWAPEVFTPMHNVHTILYIRILLHKDRGCAVGTTACRDRRVAESAAAINGDDGVEAQGLVDDPLEVSAGFEGFEGEVLRRGIGTEG